MNPLLSTIYERLEVTSASEILLDMAPRSLNGRKLYRACAHSRTTYVERTVAARLRVVGAAWVGDVRHDPCPVA